MKINGDIHNVDAYKIPASRKTTQAVKAAPDPGYRMLNAERSVGEALSIARMSQNLIQRAMAISLRLQNIATEAMFTGKINAREVNEALTDIRVVFANFGEHFTAPPQLSGRASNNTPRIPEITSEMRTMQDIAVNLKNGNLEHAGRIDALYKSLSDKSRSVRAVQDEIAGSMKTTAAEHGLNSQELASRVKSAIEKNPAHAMRAQGNINRAAAGSYLV
jgi:hypothetical protein